MPAAVNNRLSFLGAAGGVEARGREHGVRERPKTETRRQAEEEEEEESLFKADGVNEEDHVTDHAGE